MIADEIEEVATTSGNSLSEAVVREMGLLYPLPYRCVYHRFKSA